MSLARVLVTDFRLLHHMCHISNDFVEGIRAKLIGKDDNAHWKPATNRRCGFTADILYFSFFLAFFLLQLLHIAK